MKCSEVIDRLEEYISGEVDEHIKDSIELHLKRCADCTNEYNELKGLINNIRGMYKSIKVPEELEALTVNGRNKSKRLLSFKKIGIAAACFVLILSISMFTPIFAEIEKNISGIIKYFALGDKGIVNSIQNGFGQDIEKSCEDNGIKFTVHNIVADDNRTVVLFSVEYKGEEDIDYITIPAASMVMKNQFGRTVQHECTGYTFDKENKRITGKYETEPLSMADWWVSLGFDKIDITKWAFKEEEFDFKEGSAENVYRKIELDSKYVKNMVLNNVVFEDGILKLEYEIEMVEGYNAPHPRLVFKKEDGSFAAPFSSLPYWERGGTIRMRDEYRLENLDFDRVKFGVKYNEMETRIEGNWKVSFKPDRDRAEAETVKKVINKRVDIEGKTFNIKEIIFTPSQTRLCIEKEVHRPPTDFLLDEFTLVSGGKVLRRQGSSGNFNTQVYEFEPVSSFKDLKLVVNRIKLIRQIDAEFNLNKFGQGEETTVEFDGLKAKMSCRYTGDGGLEVLIRPVSPGFIEVNGGYILDSNNEKVFCSRIDFVPEDDKITQKSVLRFDNVETSSVSLHISAVSELKEVNKEIPIN